MYQRQHDKFDLTEKDIYLNDLVSQNKMSLNFGTALKIFESIITNFDEDKTSTVESYPTVPGRFEEVSKNPIKIIDGAHNASSLETLVSFIEENHTTGDFDIYIGMKKGKNIIELLTSYGWEITQKLDKTNFFSGFYVLKKLKT